MNQVSAPYRTREMEDEAATDVLALGKTAFFRLDSQVLMV